MSLIKLGAAILVAVNLLLIPAKSFAEPFEERLFSTLRVKNKTTYLAVNVFTDKLNQRLGTTFPADALDDKDYELLAVEIISLSNKFEELGENYNRAFDDIEWQKKLDILLSTILAASNPKLTGACSKLGIDLESAENSKGDWRQVKAGNNWRLTHQAPGSEIKPSSYLHTKLYWYYRLGCGGKMDLETARKVLFDISDLEPPNLSERSGLRAEFRHCVAEIWARYGIGGPVDVERAEQFSKRYAKATFFFREDTPESHAKAAIEYPDEAKRNFGCPRPNYYLDPRNPWSRLW